MPTNTVEMPKNIVRRFWLTAKLPADTKAGLYKGKITVKPENGGSSQLPVELRVRQGTLDELDIPAGPWGYEVPYSDTANLNSLKKIREYGFNLFSSGVMLWFSGIDKDGNANLGVPWVDRQDKLMEMAKGLGFKAVMYYGTMVGGYNAYQIDTAAMQANRFTDYSKFLKAIYTAVDKRAKEKGWLPYYVNLCDEPRDQGLAASMANAQHTARRSPKARRTSPAQPALKQRPAEPGPLQSSQGAARRQSGTGHCEASGEGLSATQAETGPSTTAATAGRSATTCTKPPSNSA